MRVPTSSSLFLATLASSSSIASMVSAAPTAEPSDPVAAVNGIAAPTSNDITGVIGSAGIPLTRRELESRQLGGVVDTLAAMLSPLDSILGALGLERTSAAGGASAESLSQLDQGTISKVTGLLQGAAAALPAPVPSLPSLPSLAAIPSLSSLPVAAPGLPTGSLPLKRNDKQQQSSGVLPGVPGVPAGYLPFVMAAAKPATNDTPAACPSYGAAGLPSPPVALPVGLPVAVPGAPSPPGGAPAPPGGAHSPPGGAPSPPGGAPSLPIPTNGLPIPAGLPSLPVPTNGLPIPIGSSPLSPPMPPNPPNTPVPAPAIPAPPLF